MTTPTSGRSNPPASQEQRDEIIALASHLGRLLCSGDPTAVQIERKARKDRMTYAEAVTLYQALSGAISALEGGNVIVGPWGKLYT
jgi:hypothetical protein